MKKRIFWTLTFVLQAFGGPAAAQALLQPEGPGLVADFVADRGEGILGASVQVGDLETARAFVNGNTGLNLQAFKYKGRDRFLIPAALTHGFLIEMVE
jgi:hypothetical protein